MKRIVGLTLVWSLIAFAMAIAHPARPLYEPEAPPKPPPPRAFVNVTGTAWAGKYNAANRTYVFEADGTVSYSSTGKTVFKGRGNWQLVGDTLHFTHHIGVAGKTTMEFRGVVKDADTIVGEQVMTATGAKTTVTMKRTANPGVK